MDQKKLILHGDCLKKFRNQGIFVGGWPPAEPYPIWTIVDRIDYTEIGPDLRERMSREVPFFETHLEELLKERDKSA